MVYYIHRQVQHIQIQVNKKDLQKFKKVLTKVNENDILIIQGKQYKTLVVRSTSDSSNAKRVISELYQLVLTVEVENSTKI